MEALTITLIEQLLEELTKTQHISVAICGPLKDSVTVALPTFFGGLLGGPVGAVLGAATGTGILGFSKALGYGNYKSLVTVLREDFTEEERNDLYERLWNKLKDFVTNPLNQSMLYSSLKALTNTVEQNPEVLENIKNELQATLKKKHMTLS